MLDLAPFFCFYSVPLIRVWPLEFVIVETSEVECVPGYTLIFICFKPSDSPCDRTLVLNQKVINFKLCDTEGVFIKERLY